MYLPDFATVVILARKMQTREARHPAFQDRPATLKALDLSHMIETLKDHHR